ncbi:hypothetical protein MSHI_19930 [Mycobacterium shinjukuense]|uniref:DUF222 domain-containing protein n=1 Tax=Mycobacterium shinjukuense TaxID=398694 RepID=A0A7I7MQM4_9MYCO|nr:hypothetical protein MSHI_19930 [Mycobacterium shinjukuense]
MDREVITAAFDALDAGVDAVLGLDCEALSTQERLVLLERVERVRRRLPAAEHPLINQLARQASAEELGGKLAHAIAEWTLISRAEATRRIAEAAELGPRRALTGQPLAPVLAASAAAQRAGQLGGGQIGVIRRFSHRLPGWVDAPTRDCAEATLAKEGTRFRPEQLAGLADKLADCRNPDGNYRDKDRARRRGITLGKQQADGMSGLRGWLTPQGPGHRGGGVGQAGRPRHGQTPPTKPRAWTAHPASRASSLIPAARPNASTMASTPGCARCWPAASWANTTACRPASS